MMQLLTKPAQVFAHYFKIPVRFADVANLAIFDGKSVISHEQLYSYDSDSSTIFQYGDMIESVGKRRDNIMLAFIEGKPVLIAIEHQQTIDYSMCNRILSYDDNTYNQQYDMLDESARRYLHPIPVITAVLYTGERYWRKPRKMTDRMMVPQSIKEELNDWDGHIVDIKEIDVNKLQCQENREIVEAVQRLYQWNKKIESIADIRLSKESAIVVSTIIGEEELIGYIENTEEEVINMCTAIREYRQEGLQEGLQDGLRIGEANGMKIGEVKGMRFILTTLLQQKLGKISEEITKQLEKSNVEQLNTLTLQINDIEKEEDVMKILS